MREALATAALAGVGPAAGDMSAAVNFGGFDTLLGGYQDYLALYAQARGLFIRDRLSYKPVLGVPPFAQGPGDIAVFSAIYEIIRKLNHMLLVGRFYGAQEELGTGTSCILNAFAGDAVGIARTAIEDAPASDATFYRLHSAFARSPAGLFTATRGQGVACAVCEFCFAARLCARLDGSCSLV